MKRDGKIRAALAPFFYFVVVMSADAILAASEPGAATEIETTVPGYTKLRNNHSDTAAGGAVRGTTSPSPVSASPVSDNSSIEVRGIITEIDGRFFTLTTGTQQFRVDTRNMVYNPMDTYGRQRIKEGDHVAVTGEAGEDLIGKREIIATTVITLGKDKARTESPS